MGDTENEEKRVDTVKDYTDEFEGRLLTGEFSLTNALVVFVSYKNLIGTLFNVHVSS